MSTASEPIAARPRVAPPRLNLLPEPPPAPKRSMWSRLPWLLGVAVLAVTLLSASKLMNSGSGDSSLDSAAPPPVATEFGATAALMCHGSVDVESKVLELAPTQMGEIVALLVSEGQQVKEGDPILKINEEPARLAIAQAEVGVKAAEALLAQAKQGIEQLQRSLEEQQSAIDAAQAQLSSAESDFKRLEGLKAQNL